MSCPSPLQVRFRLEKKIKHLIQTNESDIKLWIKNSQKIGEFKLVIELLEVTDVDEIKRTGDKLLAQIDSGIGILFSSGDDKPFAVIVLTDDLIKNGLNAGKMAKEILPKLLTTTGAIKDLVTSEGGSQISDESALLTVVNQVLGDNGDVVEKIKKGKTQAAGFLMGQVMKVTQGKANPDIVRSLILSEVEKR